MFLCVHCSCTIKDALIFPVGLRGRDEQLNLLMDYLCALTQSQGSFSRRQLPVHNQLYHLRTAVILTSNSSKRSALALTHYRPILKSPNGYPRAGCTFSMATISKSILGICVFIGPSHKKGTVCGPCTIHTRGRVDGTPWGCSG